MLKVIDNKIAEACNLCNEVNEKYNYLLTWILIISYKFAIDILFSTTLKNTDYIYQGESSILRYIIGTILYITIAMMLPKKEDGIYSVFLNAEFIITIAPLFCVLGWTNASPRYAIMVWVCMLLQIIMLKTKNKGLVKSIHIKGLSSYLIVGSILLSVFCFLTHLTMNNGYAGLSSFNFENTYTIRRSLRYPVILSYLFVWCRNIIIPFLTVYYLDKKKKLISAGLIVLEIMFFMATGEKVILFTIPVVLGIYFLCKKKIVVLGMYVVFLLSSAMSIIVTFLKPNTSISILINALFGNRFLAYPAILKFRHYDLFSEFPKVLFSEGMLRKVFSLTNIYKSSIGNSVSDYVMCDNVNVQSNTGYLGESYAQFGFAGMLLMTLLLIFLVKFLQKVSSNISLAIVIPILILLVVILNDGAVLTLILTSGYGIFVVICACLNKENGEEQW